MNMLTRIGSVVGCMFAAAMLAKDPSLKMWAAFVALVFVYAGHEIAEHRAKREAKRKQEASAQEIHDLRVTEAALREEDRRKQEPSRRGHALILDRFLPEAARAIVLS